MNDFLYGGLQSGTFVSLHLSCFVQGMSIFKKIQFQCVRLPIELNMVLPCRHEYYSTQHLYFFRSLQTKYELFMQQHPCPFFFSHLFRITEFITQVLYTRGIRQQGDSARLCQAMGWIPQGSTLKNDPTELVGLITLNNIFCTLYCMLVYTQAKLPSCLSILQILPARQGSFYHI